MRWHPLWAASCLMNDRPNKLRNSLKEVFPRVPGCVLKQKKIKINVETMLTS
jgi:hypothetical protein